MLPWLGPWAAGPSTPAWRWIVSAAAAVLLWTLAAWRPAPPAVPRGLAWACTALGGWAAVSAGSLRPEHAVLFGALVLIVLVATAARDPLVARGLEAGLLAAAAATAVIGLLQYLGAAPRLAPWVSPVDAGIAFGNLRQTNQYASFCWMGVALVLWGGLPLPRPARVALVALLAVGAAASVSRTGMLQGGLLLALALLWRSGPWRERLGLCIVAMAAYAGGTVLLPLLLESLTGQVPVRTLWTRLGGADGCASRLVLWSNVLHLIAQKPLAGWGWGELDYAHYITSYEQPRFCEILDNAHNLPLQLAVELGVPMALLACGGALLWAWRQRPWREEKPRRQLAWALLAVILLHSLLEYPLWYGPFQLAFGACLGWLLAEDPPSRPASPRRRSGLAAVLLAALAYTAWDYVRVTQVYLAPEERCAAWADDPLASARRSWLFAGPADFAALTLATPTRDNAAWMADLARRQLHYSPEPRVIERLVESATLLGREDEAVLHLARYRAAFPRQYAAWRLQLREPD